VSGGERNSVYHWKEDGNLLRLNEPNNDLDTETLSAREA